MGISIETYEGSGIRMKWFRFGKGDRPIVIIPGLSVQSVMGSSEQIAEAYSTLSEDFCIYVFDRKEDVTEGYSIREMAEDTVHVIRALGLSDICLFGASQGGMISICIAIYHPDLVSRLVLGSTSACIKDEQASAISEWIGLAVEGKKEELYLSFAGAIYPEEVFEQYRDVFISLSSSVSSSDLERFIILASSIKGFNVIPELTKIRCPVLIMGAFEDKVLDPDDTMAIAEILDRDPKFRLFMYTGYGHAAFDTAPDYKERIKAFLMDRE